MDGGSNDAPARHSNTAMALLDVGGAGGDMGRRRSTASTHSQSGSSSPSSARKRRQHCTYCKNHDRQTRKSNHRCIYETCSCLLCQLTRVSRLIMRHQQRLWRHLKDTNRREHPDMDGGGAVGSSKQQKCDMCRNHGVMKEKRAHKNACPYQDCDCSLCGLTRKRRDIMRHQQRVRRSKVVTRELQDEVYDYVIKTTEELAKLSQESNLLEPPALEPPALPPPYSHHDPAPQVRESARPPTPPSPMSLSPPCPSSPQAPSRGVVVPPREPSTLESLVVPQPHHDPEAGLEGLGGSAWRNFKREREDSTAAVTFTPLPQVRHDVGFSVSLGACRAPTLTPPPSLCPADTLGPYKKTRVATISQDLPITTPSAFWGTGHLEAFNSHCPDLYSPGYRRLPPCPPYRPAPDLPLASFLSPSLSPFAPGPSPLSALLS